MVLPSPRELWNNWSVQFLVLVSLFFQVFLFLFVGIRRRGAHPVLRFLLWLAYQLSDYTATFALGHISIKGAHPIVALWAPFLLLHLGGPDNITAYSLEDNRLWTRHLLSAILHVLGAAYILVEITATASLRLASILMFAVGTVKYVEKTQAQMRSNLDTIRGSVKKQPPAMHRHFHPQDKVLKGGVLDEESHVRLAHSLFHICKRAIVDYPVIEDDSRGQDATNVITTEVLFWYLMEHELSLMYDMLYTKAAVIHTTFGYSVRLVSPLAIVASFLLFRQDAHHEAADVVITYVLYGGAFFMEMTSLLNALGSSWTFAFLSTTRCRWLQKAALCEERWDRLRRLVAYLHHLARVGLGGGSRYTSRTWSCTVGQYNMLHFCTRSQSALLGRASKKVGGLGLHEWWNTGHHSWDTNVPTHVLDYISKHMQRVFMDQNAINALGMLKYRWGEETLVRHGLFKEGYLQDSLGDEFQECIIIWHIGTDVFLAKRGRKEEEASCQVEAIKLISNYMMYLLVQQPDMLPGLSQNRLYQRTCENLVNSRPSTDPRCKNLFAKLKDLFRLRDDPASNSRVIDREELAKTIYDKYVSTEFSQDSPRLPYVANLARELLWMEENGPVDSVKLVLDVWMDILFYASSKCSRKAHAAKLSSGIELTTILWLMSEIFYYLYMERVSEDSNDFQQPSSSQGDGDLYSSDAATFSLYSL